MNESSGAVTRAGHMTSHLLQVTQNVHPAVKDVLPLRRVEIMDEICGEVFVTLLIPTGNNPMVY